MENMYKKLKPDTLTKMLFVVFFIASGLLLSLFFQLSSINKIENAKAQTNDNYPYLCASKRRDYNPGCAGAANEPNHEFDVYCNNQDCNESPGNCIVKNSQCLNGNAIYPTSIPTQPDNSINWPNGANCRYLTGKGQCASSEFKLGSCNPKVGEMCYCGPDGSENEASKDVVAKIDGYTYMRTVRYGKIGCKINSNEDLCATRYGLQYGDGTTCNNPYRCPDRPTTTPTIQPTPTPTPTPTHEEEKREVKVSCENLLVYDIEGNRYLNSGDTVYVGRKYRLIVKETSTSPRYGTRYAYKLGDNSFQLISNPNGPNFGDFYNPPFIEFVIPNEPGKTIDFRGANLYKINGGRLVADNDFSNRDNDYGPNVITCGAPMGNFRNGFVAYRNNFERKGYISTESDVKQKLRELNAVCEGSINCQKTFNIASSENKQVNLTCKTLNVYDTVEKRYLTSNDELIQGRTYRLQVETDTNPRFGTRYAYKLNNGDFTLISNPKIGDNYKNDRFKGDNFGDIYEPTYVEFTVPNNAQGQITFRGANVFKIENGQIRTNTQAATYFPDNDNNPNIVTCGAPLNGNNPYVAYRTQRGYMQDNDLSILQSLGTTCIGSMECQKVFKIKPLIEKKPDVKIEKVLEGENFKEVNSVINFRINVQNTGDVDIMDFNLSDNFDLRYLEFVSSRFLFGNNEVNFPPDAQLQQEGRYVLNWNSVLTRLKNQGLDDGVLKYNPNGNGEIFTLKLTFIIKRETSANLIKENDNCGVVGSIQYDDSQGQRRETTLNSKESCVEFNTRTRTPLNVQVNKTILTPSVQSPNEVRFRVLITNNDSNRRTYTDIDFTDEYERIYLNPKEVIITKWDGRQARITGFDNTGILSVPNLQDLCDGGESVRLPCSRGYSQLGELDYGMSYTLELVFDSLVPVENTCDEVIANVKDNEKDGASGSAEACVNIVSPQPPDTGANMFLNLILPSIFIIISSGANLAIMRKYK